MHIPLQLRKTLASTNVIESAFSIVERVCSNVKRWHGGDQRERWVGSGLLVAEKQFRRIQVGHWDKVSMHGGYAAKNLVETKGVSILQGHTHRFGAHARTTVDGRVLLGIENFSMCRREASYVANPNWQLGFSVIYLDAASGRCQWFPVAIGDRGFVWLGREYGRGY